MKKYICENYKQAVITCVWVVESGYRELLFAMVELIPRFYGDEQSIVEQGVKVKGRRLYYVRHVLSPADAYDWYDRSIRNRELEMPWDDNHTKRIYFCAKGNDLRLQESVAFPGTLYNDVAPFRTKLWRGAQMHHLMQVERVRHLEEFIASDVSISQWLENRLLWSLHQHIEYLGSLNMVLPNPYYGHLHMRLIPQEQVQSPERIEISPDRDCSSAGLRLFMQEKNVDEYGRYIEHSLPLAGGAITVDGIVDRIGYCVVDKHGRVIDREDYTSFIRKIVTNFICKDATTHVVCRDGSVQEVSLAVRETREIGGEKELKELKLRNKRCDIRLSREQEKEAKNQIFYYREGGDAEKFLRSLVLMAYKRLIIIDPYFSETSAKMFLSHLNHGVVVDVICTAEGFKTEGTAESFKKTLADLPCRDCSIKTLVAGNGQLHDRFLIIDDMDVWMLGSSMRSLGDSLSVIVKLKDPVTVIEHLNKVITSFNAPTLEDWISKNNAQQ